MRVGLIVGAALVVTLSSAASAQYQGMVVRAAPYAMAGARYMQQSGTPHELYGYYQNYQAARQYSPPPVYFRQMVPQRYQGAYSPGARGYRVW